MNDERNTPYSLQLERDEILRRETAGQPVTAGNTRTRFGPDEDHEMCDTEIARLSDMVLSPGVRVAIVKVNNWLDSEVAPDYQDQPLAQDWARATKPAEEAGEVVKALIACTGQNPRKGISGTQDEMLAELADTAWAAIFGIQHFTGDRHRTAAIVEAGLRKALKRAEAAGY